MNNFQVFMSLWREQGVVLEHPPLNPVLLTSRSNVPRLFPVDERQLNREWA